MTQTGFGRPAEVDFNADLGESFGTWSKGADEAMLKVVTSANVACGFHAGDPATMRRTVDLARENGVVVGAHPGLPDLMGFGRRRMEISAADAEDYTSYQVGAMDAFLTAAGLRLHHVKPHGALYALALEDDGIAAGIARAVARLHAGTLLYTLKGSAMWAQAQAHGLRPVAEFYADRPLHRDGSYEFFRWRELFDPLPEAVAARVLTALTSGLVPSVEGPSVAVEIDSISIHADTPGAELVAQAIWRALEGAGITPKAL